MRPFIRIVRLALITALPLCLPSGIAAQTPTAEEVLARSMAHHDPNATWGRFSGTFAVMMESPGSPGRLSRISMDQPGSFFGIRIEQDSIQTELELRKGDCRLSYNGSEVFSEEVASTYRLTCERARLWRDYYSYLYGLPMKLRDKGTRLDPKVERRDFHGKSVWALRVTYDPETGSDVWYFYFDPGTYALSAYQFFHDPAKNDGEYILLEGEARVGGMRLPRTRKWYTNKEGRLLGTDTLTEAD